MTHRRHRHRHTGTILAALAVVCVIASAKCDTGTSPGAVTTSTTAKATTTTTAPTTTTTTAGATTTTTAPPASTAIRQVHDPLEVTGTITGPCRLRGDLATTWLPDPRCTPGAYDPSITAQELCSAGYTTSSYRPPESQTEHAKWDEVEPAYRLHDLSGELDHLIPLELGGSNDLSNLWVEPGSIPNPKDAEEGALHRWVCANPSEARLRAAQEAIATDWVTAGAKLGVNG